jgi:hypothetical protein
MLPGERERHGGEFATGLVAAALVAVSAAGTAAELHGG